MADIMKLARSQLESANRQEHQHIAILQDRTEIYAQDKTLLYYPSPTAEQFKQDNSPVKLVMGPYGSGKSTLCVENIVRRVCEMPAWYHGRRKARWGIVRNTSGELQSTTLQTWLAWFYDLGDLKRRQKPILTYEHRFRDERGTVELELIFLALDRPDDVKKIKSLELTGVYLNELSELPSNVLAHFKGRVGRYPGPNFCPEPYHSEIIADTNPCDEDSWIYRDFFEKPVEGYKLFKQPAGLIYDKDKWITNPHADNIKNLPPNYYTHLASGQTENFIKVFCLGDWGSVGDGKLVYPEYNDDLHSIPHVDAEQGTHLYLGWDFGLTPTCVVCQITSRGKLLVLKEYTSSDMGIKTFAESVVLPALVRDFPYCKVGESVGDPAGNNRSEIMEELSCIGELNHVGINTRAAKSNDPEPRIGSVRYFLNRMVDGKPAFVLSRTGCPVLRKGFLKDYVYKRMAVPGEERYKDKPDKNLSSHPHDGLQYVCMEIASDSISKDKSSQPAVDMFNPVFRYL